MGRMNGWNGTPSVGELLGAKEDDGRGSSSRGSFPRLHKMHGQNEGERGRERGRRKSQGRKGSSQNGRKKGMFGGKRKMEEMRLTGETVDRSCSGGEVALNGNFKWS